jgi:hypothetical protein
VSALESGYPRGKGGSLLGKVMSQMHHLSSSPLRSAVLNKEFSYRNFSSERMDHQARRMMVILPAATRVKTTSNTCTHCTSALSKICSFFLSILRYLTCK